MLLHSEIRGAFAFLRRATTLQETQDTLVVMVPGPRRGSRDAVKVSLFGREFQPAASLKALTYFKDGDLGRLSGDDRRTLIEAAKLVRAFPVVKRRSKKLA